MTHCKADVEKGLQLAKRITGNMCCGVSKYCEKKKMIANNLEKRKRWGR